MSTFDRAAAKAAAQAAIDAARAALASGGSLLDVAWASAPALSVPAARG